jgi:hypothetical protein
MVKGHQIRNVGAPAAHKDPIVDIMKNVIFVASKSQAILGTLISITITIEEQPRTSSPSSHGHHHHHHHSANQGHHSRSHQHPYQVRKSATRSSQRLVHHYLSFLKPSATSKWRADQEHHRQQQHYPNRRRLAELATRIG